MQPVLVHKTISVQFKIFLLIILILIVIASPVNYGSVYYIVWVSWVSDQMVTWCLRAKKVAIFVA